MSEHIQLRRVPNQQQQVNIDDEPLASVSGASVQEHSPFNLWEKVAYSSVTHFLLLLALCGFIGIGLPIIWTQVFKAKNDLTIESDLRYECYPLREAQEVSNASCLSWKGTCTWDNFTTGKEIACYYEQETENDIRNDLYGSNYFGKLPRYSVILKDGHEHEQQKHNETLETYNVTDPLVHVLRMETPPPFLDIANYDLNKNPVIHSHLSVQERYYSANHMSVLIKPFKEADDLWSRHFDFIYPKLETNQTLINGFNGAIQVTPSSASIRKDIFQLQVLRKSTKAPLFNMGMHTPFVYAQGYIEISTMLVNDIVYGLGQSNLPTFRHNFSTPKTWTLLNQYTKNLTENTTSMFGSQPFYMGIDDPTKGDAYGVLLLNSHPITVTTNAKPSLTFKTFGGHLELHFFLGPRPADVVRQLQEFIRFPAMPPYWALGFHACTSTCHIPSPSTMEDLISKDVNIPVESDCGTAIRRASPDNFLGLSQKLNSYGGRKYISVEAPHRFHNADKQAGLDWTQYSLRTSSLRAALSPYTGQHHQCDFQNILREESGYYPDFFSNQTYAKYKDDLNLQRFANGYFLDFNTPLNLANDNGTLVCLTMLKDKKWNAYNFGKMNELNPCLDVQFSKDGFYERMSANETKSWYMGPYMALHNMYGFKQAEAIYKISLETQPKLRPMVMSLATFIGSGRYGGHIGAPLNSNWTALRLSLKQTLDFSIFGIPLSGYPVGGYRGEDPKDELLRRWFQLASVQPFMIAYSDFNVKSRVMIASAREAIRSNIQTRYKLLPYFYTLFHEASTTGSLVVQPLFMEFYSDEKVYKINDQFMIGQSLLASPALIEGDTVVKAYFPKGRWYEYYSGHLTSKKDGGFQEISAVEQNINLHIRGGHVVPIHYKTEQTIRDTRKNSGFQIIAALNEDQHAEGSLYIDDGISYKVAESLQVEFKFNYTFIDITVSTIGEDRFCRLQHQFATADSVNTKIESIKIYGIIEKPEKSIVSIYTDELHKNKVQEIQEPKVKFQNNYGVLTIDAGIDLCASNYYHLSWTYVQY